MEKFRLGRKPIDRGNKKRLVKNLMRFIKNPLGYVYYKMAPFMLASNPRIIPVLIGLAFFCALYEWKKHSNQIKAYDDILLGYGKNVEGMSGRYGGFHDKKMLRGPTNFDMLFRVPIENDQIVINPTWKQNLRKELQLTNSYNVQF